MIGERIRTIRTVKGLSQDYVANMLEISQPAYSDIEKGKSKVNFEKLQNIADIFEMTVQEVISFDEKQIFNNTFNEKSKGFFNIKKIVKNSFNNERKAYQDQINYLKEEIAYLKSKLDEKK
jgi:transcriptional regulator with XRE-family HTH domain